MISADAQLQGLQTKPLMKNWLALESKNLAPEAEMVGMALTVETANAATKAAVFKLLEYIIVREEKAN